ncbi:alpha/beta hydrolase [Solibacillus isronensis]|uniref:alpha/beta hydrolase n=1 Tax=Solibacillus isronensis TaxID=412383 RepID=UPI002040BDF3|nr:alpha/beta hydrolase-fold protein [Solibacillus isronensis]MCM3721319.1 alpha/beta hydrolase-fold protein [Solibacillus isronensis]
MQSKYNGYSYILDIYVPNEIPPAEGFPLIIVLDGTRYSKLMYETMAMQLRNRKKTLVDPAIIVGIGHDDKDITKQRFYDFTAPAVHYHFPVRRGKVMQELPAGGAVQFLDFILQQIVPMLQEKYAVDDQKISLYGHSLGGLFVLWSYLIYPDSFYKYVALSPSIWWNNHELFRTIRQVENPIEAPIFIGVGGKEGDMVDDAQKFVAMASEKWINFEFYIAESENHASVIPTTMSRVLRFLKSDD